MIWHKTKDDHYTCGDYRIVTETRGYSVWVFSDAESARLGLEIAKLSDAKGICEKHLVAQGEAA